MIDRMEWGGRWGWSVWSTRALESLNNEQGVNSRTSMFCDVDDDADDSHVHHRRRNFRMIPEWKFRFFGGMWNFICEYLLKASVIQSVRAHTNRSRRHMILNEFPFAAFVRLLARIEIWIYILHSCVCDNNRILHIAYVSHERPFSANDVEDEKSHIDAWMLPLPFFNNSTYGRTKHHNQVQIKWKLIDSKYDIRWNGTIKWMTTKITKWSIDRLHSMSIQLAILEYIYILILMSGIFMALLWNVTPQVSHTESKRCHRIDGRALKILLIVAWKATIIALCPFLFELNILFCDRPLWKSRAYNTKNSTPEICVFQLRRTNDAISLRQTNYILFLLLYSRLMFGQNRSVKSWKEWNCCAMRRMAKKKMKEAIRKSIQFDWMNWS